MAKSIIIPNGRAAGADTIKAGGTFSGEVWVDPISFDDDLAMAQVIFTPCARSYWHTHEGGQVLRVDSGSGWICDKGGEARRIKAGDVVWAPPGTTHWHGADDGSYLSHFAIGIGKTVWHAEVDDAEYGKKHNQS